MDPIEIVVEEVEFDQELYDQNIEENEFSIWDDEDGVGTDPTDGSEIHPSEEVA